ncbi:MAG TPA: nitrilase-related carbon-nitrogen hydrolase, partial [Chthoniobacterales bacterium]|nr:nitrilase-related carbon-nitrogen hydrolase [Chthoniobacterales bacterium]
RFARELSLGIIAGVSERLEDCIFNSLVAIGPGGEIVGQYRKTHLFAPSPVEEHKCFAAGGELVTLPVGGSSRIGLSICYDLRFPEFYRALAVNHGANVLVISSAWPFPRLEHLRALSVARAIENQSYVVLANRVGKDGGVTFCGSSAIIDPYGVLIAAASPDREELVSADLSDEVIETVREQMQVFEHRRPEVYAR